MRFLADESCDGRLVEALRAAGHDVLAISSVASGATDNQVVSLANEQGRVVITEDKDFGQYFFASGQPSPGVVLLRVPVTGRKWLLQSITSIIASQSESLVGRFMVVEPGKIRLT